MVRATGFEPLNCALSATQPSKHPQTDEQVTLADILFLQVCGAKVPHAWSQADQHPWGYQRLNV
jgi:hypothetical protein